jgi:hypothetical protein
VAFLIIKEVYLICHSKETCLTLAVPIGIYNKHQAIALYLGKILSG